MIAVRGVRALDTGMAVQFYSKIDSLCKRGEARALGPLEFFLALQFWKKIERVVGVYRIAPL
jgi:hypothetical protein